MVKFIGYFFCLYFLCVSSLNAQITSGYMGKKNVFNVGFSPNFTFLYTLPPYTLAEYTRIFTKKLSVGGGIRISQLSSNAVERTSNNVSLEEANLLQYNLFIEINSANNWQMSPLGLRHKFGIARNSTKYNAIKTSKIYYSWRGSELVKQGITDSFSWNSIFYEIHLRKPIWKTICYDIGTGVEIPVAFGLRKTAKFPEIAEDILITTAYSKLIYLGISYIF